jgi:osmoprotectant transport system permease protein
VHFLGQVVDWFTTSSHWHGVGGIPHRVQQHVAMSVIVTLAAAAVALPIGVWLGHVGRGGVLAVNISNIGRAVPSFAVLVIAEQVSGQIGAVPAFAALFLLAIPPMLTNAYTGVRGVDPELREASEGMGLTGPQTLFRVELPLALPLIMAGVRTAAVQVVATATLAAVVAWGGLGRYIVDGLGARDDVQIFAGAVMVLALAFATEVVLGVVQRRLTPRGLRPTRPGPPDVVKNEPFLAAAVAPGRPV